MLPTRSLRVAIVALAVLIAACGDVTKPAAYLANVPRTDTLYAFTGAPVNAPTAFYFMGSAAVPANALFGFDVAFDLDANGKTLVYPVRNLGGPLANLQRAMQGQSYLQRVGLQILPGSFDAIASVPTGGYDTLSVQRLVPGQVLAANVLDPSCVYSTAGRTIVAKITVDSVNTTTRRIYTRTVVDPNCGYFSVMPDSIPKS